MRWSNLERIHLYLLKEGSFGSPYISMEHRTKKVGSTLQRGAPDQ